MVKHNVLEMVRQEKNQQSAPEECIFSDFYHIAMSYPQSMIDSVSDPDEKQRMADANSWPDDADDIVKEVKAFSVDTMKARIKENGPSCDALCYHAAPLTDDPNLLIEFKNSDKKTALEFLSRDSQDKESISAKVRNSAHLLRDCLTFTGGADGEDLIRSMHFIYVYSGRNNLPLSQFGNMLRKERVSEPGRRQRHASTQRNRGITRKNEKDVYANFEQMISSYHMRWLNLEDLGYKPTIQPDPEAKYFRKERSRAFTVMSRKDLLTIIRNKYFEDWDWGEYAE